MSPSERAHTAARLDGLVRELTAVLDRAQADGGVAALPADASRRLVAAAARLHATAADEGAEPPQASDMAPTEAVMLASALLRAHGLNPFDLALWFSRGAGIPGGRER